MIKLIKISSNLPYTLSLLYSLKIKSNQKSKDKFDRTSHQLIRNQSEKNESIINRCLSKNTYHLPN